MPATPEQATAAARTAPSPEAPRQAAAPEREAVSDYERERGKPMPSKLHSITQKRLILALASFEPRIEVMSELTLQLDGHRLTPDLSVYPSMEIDFTEDEVRMTEPPLLAVEIASPTQTAQALVDKIRVMLGAGVASCWLVQPLLQTVTVFTSEGHRTVSEGVLHDAAVDVEVDLADVFR